MGAIETIIHCYTDGNSCFICHARNFENKFKNEKCFIITPFLIAFFKLIRPLDLNFLRELLPVLK
jgi:hypothetical protein